MNIRATLALVAALVLAGCAATQPSNVQPAAPAPTVTVTTTVSPTAEPSEDEETDQPSSAATGWSADDVADRSAGQHTRTADVARWTLVEDLLGRRVKARFDAVIRSASYLRDGALNKNVTLSFDRVKWNPKFTDGGNEDIMLNPDVKWETVTSGDLLVLVMPGDGPHQMPIADLPAYLKAEAAQSKESGADWSTPFTVYCVGDRPVALVEWYMP
jgi:hypothetical protein